MTQTLGYFAASPKPASLPLMDPLSDVLRTIELSGVTFLRGDFRGEYGLVMPPPTVQHPLVRPRSREHRLVMFHVVQDGACYLEVEGYPAERMGEGDLVILFDDIDHVLVDTPGRRTIHSSEVVPEYPEVCAPPIVYIGDGPRSLRIVCGMLQLVDRGFNPVFDALPPYILLTSDSGVGSAWLQRNLQHLISAATSAAPGSHALLNRLTEALFIEALRTYIAALPATETGWLAALGDEVVGKALQCMHEAPAEPWTVAKLAQAIGASRSTLAARFQSVLGMAPIGYLTRWRIRLGTNLLRDGVSVTETARSVGYESEAAFSRAFKREMGASSRAWVGEARA